MSRHRTQPHASRCSAGRSGDRPAPPVCEQIERPSDQRRRRRARRVIAAYHAESARRARARTVELVLAGCHIGRVPYGYRPTRAIAPGSRRRRGDTTMLAVEPIEAATVAMVFSWRTHDRLGAAEIARRLNAARYPRPVHPVTQREVPWTGRQVTGILANPVYSGRSVWGRGRGGRPVPAELWVLSGRREYAAIVSDEQFLAAQNDRRVRLALATRFATDSSAGILGSPQGPALDGGMNP